MASQCYNAGRIQEAVRYADAGRELIGSGNDEVQFGVEGVLGTVYISVGQPERWVELCRAQLACGRDTHTFTRVCLAYALTVAGRIDEAMAAVDGLVDAADATGNPTAMSNARLADGYAFRNTDPGRALEALRRALVIARDCGSRWYESHVSILLSGLEAESGDPLAALDYVRVGIRNFHDSGNTTLIASPLAVLAVLFDRLGRHEPAATIAGFLVSPLVPAAFPEITSAITHLREVLGEETYESLARKGETMTTAAMATYAYDQIDQARTELEHPS
jgi:tetratricopeptide (TPR) repeat protein